MISRCCAISPDSLPLSPVDPAEIGQHAAYFMNAAAVRRFKIAVVHYGTQKLYECRERAEDGVEPVIQLFCRGQVAAGPVFNTITTTPASQKQKETKITQRFG